MSNLISGLQKRLSGKFGANYVGGAAHYIGAATAFDATGIADGTVVIASCRASVNDGGGGVFTYYASSSQTVDSGLIFLPAIGGGRLIRQGWTVVGFNGDVNVLWFGADPTGTNDSWAAITTAIASVNPYVFNSTFNYHQGGGRVYAPKGKYLLSKTLYLPDHVTTYGDECQTYIAQNSQSGTADSTIFMPISSGFSGVAVIDSSGYVVSTGQRYASAVPLTGAAYVGGTVTYTEGASLLNIAVQPNGTNGLIGVRMQGSPGCRVTVSAQGFAVNIQGISCWNGFFNDLFCPGGLQISGYFNNCNNMILTGNFDSNVFNGVGNAVTSANKPACWDPIDTVYASTSLYFVNCQGVELPLICTQHNSRGIYFNNSGLNIGSWYVEDQVPTNQQNGAYITGSAMICGNNGSTSTTPVTYPNSEYTPNIIVASLTSASNGSTVVDSVYNADITILAFNQLNGNAGVGIFYGSHTSTGLPIYLGANVIRNGYFPDTAYDARQINLAPINGTWTPTFQNLTGTVTSSSANYVKRGNLYDIEITINGTGLTTTAGASYVTTPFNNTNGFPAPSRGTTLHAVNNSVVGGVGAMSTNSNAYLPTFASSTQIIVTGTVWGI